MIEYCSNTTESEAQFTPWLMTVAFSKELKKKKKKGFCFVDCVSASYAHSSLYRAKLYGDEIIFYLKKQ